MASSCMELLLTVDEILSYAVDRTKFLLSSMCATVLGVKKVSIHQDLRLLLQCQLAQVHKITSYFLQFLYALAIQSLANP
jgi:hypothetical protein